MEDTTLVHPKPGVTIYLPGSVHGFTSGPVPMPAAHAAPLIAAGHIEAADDARPLIGPSAAD